jgi:hypothetical protein
MDKFGWPKNSAFFAKVFWDFHFGHL